MADEGAASSGSGWIVFALLVSIAAPAVGYAVVRNTALEASGNVRDPTTKLPPTSILPPMKAVMRAARRPQDRLPPGALAVARRAAVDIPLAYEPYFIFARAEEEAGRYRSATLLMEEARRRRPNSTSVRVALLGYYSLADAYQKAIDEADMAMRVNSRSMSLILPAFAQLVGADPRARRAIAVTLARKPPWRGAFLEVAATSKMKAADARALVADVRRLAPSREPQAEEAFLIRALVASGEYREARALWESYTPATLRAAAVTDDNFRGVTAFEPFNWKFGSVADGSAEVAKPAANGRPHLEVDYFGTGVLVLAEQTLGAKPGNYRLTTMLTAEGEAGDIQLNWELFCLPGSRPIATLKLVPFGSGIFRRETAVTIPTSGCEGQSLALVGRPGEVSRAVRAEINEVALTPAGRAGR